MQSMIFVVELFTVPWVSNRSTISGSILAIASYRGKNFSAKETMEQNYGDVGAPPP